MCKVQIKYLFRQVALGKEGLRETGCGLCALLLSLPILCHVSNPELSPSAILIRCLNVSPLGSSNQLCKTICCNSGFVANMFLNSRQN